MTRMKLESPYVTVRRLQRERVRGEMRFKAAYRCARCGAKVRRKDFPSVSAVTASGWLCKGCLRKQWREAQTRHREKVSGHAK